MYFTPRLPHLVPLCKRVGSGLVRPFFLGVLVCCASTGTWHIQHLLGGCCATRSWWYQQEGLVACLVQLLAIERHDQLCGCRPGCLCYQVCAGVTCLALLACWRQKQVQHTYTHCHLGIHPQLARYPAVAAEATQSCQSIPWHGASNTAPCPSDNLTTPSCTVPCGVVY
jgi:hypothetical protein